MVEEGELLDTRTAPVREGAGQWQEAFSRCIKCYGCRDACPICICKDCELEDPHWVPKGDVPPGWLFQFIRAYHIADMCTLCSACEDACPAGIPLRSIHESMRLSPPEVVFEAIPLLDQGTKEALIEATKASPVKKREVRERRSTREG